METSEGFSPIERADARILVLGSLPGQRSIAKQQYYAHPQNAFWPIMGRLFSIDGGYDERCAQLVQHCIALWDVLKSSLRPGSLDADIRLDTAVPNDFDAFLSEHPALSLIAFNGKKAEALFRKYVAPDLIADRVQLVGLPSTSPAYAAMPFDSKLAAWRTAIGLVEKQR